MPKRAHLSYLTLRALKAAIVLLAAAGAVWYIFTHPFVSGDLINNLWGPAHLLVRGQSPYNTHILSTTEEVPWLPAVWLPMAIGLFSPLGWLSQYQASQLWLIASVVMLVAIIWLAGGVRQPPPVLFGLIALSVFSFPPVLSHLVLGQFTVLTTLALILAANLVAVPNYLLAGFLVAVALSKPQLAALVVPGLFVAVGRLYRLKGIVSLAAMLALWTILLVLPLWIAYPQWVSDFVAAQGQNPRWEQPSLFMLLQLQWQNIGLLLWSVLAAAVFIANIRLWLKYRPQSAVTWSLALTLLVTPYVWSWDFVMLIPLTVATAFRLQNKISRALLGLGYLLCWSLTVWIRFNTDFNDYRFWWIPWMAIAFIGLGYATNAQLPTARGSYTTPHRDG